MIKILRNSDKHQLSLLLLICGLAFFAQDWYFISDWDDVFYKYIVSDPTRHYVEQFDDGCHQPIRTIGDIFYSQWNHYLGSNGRYLTHCLEQFFDAFVPRHVFAVLNSIVFTILLWVMMKLADKKMNIINCLLVAVALFALCPHALAIFWGNISFSINYLWVGCLTLSWYLMYEYLMQTDKEFSKWQYLLIVLSGIIIGSLQESYSIGICAGLGIYHLINFRKINKKALITVGSYFVGTCFAIFAPSNFLRVGRTGGGGSLIVDAVFDLLSTYILIALALLLIISLIVSWRKTWEYIKQNVILLTAIIVSMAFNMLFYIGWHQLTMVAIVSVILLVRLCNMYVGRIAKISRLTFVGLGVLYSISVYPQMYSFRKSLYETFTNTVNNAVTQKQKIIVDEEYEAICDNVENSIVFDYFSLHDINGAGNLSILITDGKDLHYIKAVIPDTPEVINQKLASITGESNVVKLNNHTYVCSTDSSYDKKQVIWTYRTAFHNPNKLHDCDTKARYSYAYQGKNYYVFSCPFLNVESLGIRIEK